MINRRHFTLAAASAAAATASGPAAAQASPPLTFVLIHGAWHGGWCWSRLARLLRADGHQVFAPTLTGLGERSHLMSDAITLETHIKDITNVFAFEDLNDAVLVAHSYGGWPASGALEQLEGRVASVVFVDAFLPENGQRGLDQNSPESIKAINAALERGEASRKGPNAAAFGVLPENQAWVDAKMTPQPIGVSLSAITLTGARDRVPRKSYIRAGLYKQPSFDRYLQERSATPGWQTQTIASGHDVMVDHPDKLYAMLKELT